MDILREKMRCLQMGAVLQKGGGAGPQTTQSVQDTTNEDKRNAVQDGVGVSGNLNRVTYVTNTNDPDAVKAMTNAGADIIKSAGGAIVDLNRDSVAAQSKSFDAMLTAGGALVDKVIDANTKSMQTNAATAASVVSAFKPVEGANADVAKWGAAAAVAGLALVALMKAK